MVLKRRNLQFARLWVLLSRSKYLTPDLAWATKTSIFSKKLTPERFFDWVCRWGQIRYAVYVMVAGLVAAGKILQVRHWSAVMSKQQCEHLSRSETRGCVTATTLAEICRQPRRYFPLGINICNSPVPWRIGIMRTPGMVVINLPTTMRWWLQQKAATRRRFIPYIRLLADLLLRALTTLKTRVHLNSGKGIMSPRRKLTAAKQLASLLFAKWASGACASQKAVRVYRGTVRPASINICHV